MKNNNCYVDVILPVPLQQLYTYHVPDDLSGAIIPGIRITVQFGKKKMYTAIVYRIHDHKPDNYDTKDIIAVLDEKPIVNSTQFRFWKWIADYYMCSLGEIFKAGVPSGLKLESETKLFLNDDFIPNDKMSENEDKLLCLLERKKKISIREAEKHIPVKNVYPLIKSLYDRGALFTEEILHHQYKAKTEEYVVLNPEYQQESKLNDLFNSLEKAPVQLNLLMSYISQTGYNAEKTPPEIKKEQLLKHTKTTNAPLHTLIRKGIFRIVKKEKSRLKQYSSQGEISELNLHQGKALEEIKKKFETKDVLLLHGVTSSGKTEIYIHLIREEIQKGNQVLYLLPEIALTTQIINRLRNVFGSQVGVFHSKFSDNERVEVYKNILYPPTKKEQINIVLGVRSSVFLPFSKPGLIIVDEEHENTYKQYDPAPRYNARDAAIVLAQIHGAKVLLGTATPSVESYYNAKTGKYGLVELNERYLDMALPRILIADTKEAYRKKQMKSIFTPLLLDNIDEALSHHEQVILFQNRRGYSPFLECFTCGWIPKCLHCDVSLTYHKNIDQLICHYCGHSRNIPRTCEACGNPDIKTRGFGTEKIEDELSVFFPDARVARMDLDSTRSRKSYEKIIHGFEQNKIQILVGTQMISKGLDFSNVNTVGIMNADNMLNFPDFRAFERSFQLMAQVSGRAGRKTKQGKVIIQTSNPQHTIIMDVLANKYKNMFLKQLNERKEYKYPPFYRLILIKIKGRERNTLNKASELLARQLAKVFGDRIIGPEYPLIQRIQNWYQKNIWIKIEAGKSHSKAREYLQHNINYCLSSKAFNQIRINIDVDPL